MYREPYKHHREVQPESSMMNIELYARLRRIDVISTPLEIISRPWKIQQ